MDGGGNITAQRTGEVLDCNSFKRFWVGWSGGIQIGQGRYPYGQFMNSDEAPVLKIVAVGLTLEGEGALANGPSGHWQVEQRAGMCFYLDQISLCGTNFCVFL